MNKDEYIFGTDSTMQSGLVVLPESKASINGVRIAIPEYHHYLRDLLFRMYLIDMEDPLEFVCEYTLPFTMVGSEDYEVFFLVEGELSEIQKATYYESTYDPYFQYCSPKEQDYVRRIYYNPFEDITYIKLPDEILKL